MVNEHRIEKKLAGLLVDQATSSRKGSTAYKQKEREIRKFKRQYPSRYRGLFFKLVQAVQALDQDLTRQAQEEIDIFNKSFGENGKTRTKP